MTPKFEIFRDNRGEYRFHLKIYNGQVIAASEGFMTLEAVENGIESLRQNAQKAEIVTLFEEDIRLSVDINTEGGDSRVVNQYGETQYEGSLSDCESFIRITLDNL